MGILSGSAGNVRSKSSMSTFLLSINFIKGTLWVKTVRMSFLADIRVVNFMPRAVGESGPRSEPLDVPEGKVLKNHR